MALDGLTQATTFLLIQAVDSARYLLRHGHRLLHQRESIELRLDAIMTTLSIGVEKVLKVSLGVAEVGAGRSWPDKATMKAFGHGTAAMDRTLRALLHAGMEHRPAVDYLRSVFDAVDQDPVWPVLLGSLDDYGQGGRFHNLDGLAGAPRRGKSPTAHSDAVELAASQNDPSLLALRDNGDFDEWSVGVQRAIAASLERWWFLIHRLGIHDVLGPLGKKVMWDLDPKSVLALGRPPEH